MILLLITGMQTIVSRTGVWLIMILMHVCLTTSSGQLQVKDYDLDRDGSLEHIRLKFLEKGIYLSIQNQNAIICEKQIIRKRSKGNTRGGSNSNIVVLSPSAYHNPIIVVAFDDPEFIQKGILCAFSYDPVKKLLTREKFYFGSDSEYFNSLISQKGLFHVEATGNLIACISGTASFEDLQDNVLSYYEVSQYRWSPRTKNFVLVETSLLENDNGWYVSTDEPSGVIESAFRKKFFKIGNH